MADMREKNSIRLIERLSLAFGPSGCEGAVRELIESEAGKYTEDIRTDKQGNLICKMKLGVGESRQSIMLAAHMDEVGFIVDGITPTGFLTFLAVGGINASVVSGRSVRVEGHGGVISGVIASKAVHHKSESERDKACELDKLYIDIGARDRAEAEKMTFVGAYATFESSFVCFGRGGRTLKCKALDDRMGCAAMLEIMRDLYENAPCDVLPRDIYFCFTTREEIGYSGASAAAYSIEPTLAVVLETTAISDLPDTPSHRRVAEICGGVVVSVADMATIYPRELVDFAMKTASESGIVAQIKRYVSGGNDAKAIHKSREGVHTLALSVPTRYLHSPACVAHIDDYAAQRDLAKKIILSYNRELEPR